MNDTQILSLVVITGALVLLNAPVFVQVLVPLWFGFVALLMWLTPRDDELGSHEHIVDLNREGQD